MSFSIIVGIHQPRLYSILIRDQFPMYPANDILCKHIQLLECNWNSKDQIRVRPRETECDYYSFQPTSYKSLKKKISHTLFNLGLLCSTSYTLSSG